MHQIYFTHTPILSMNNDSGLCILCPCPYNCIFHMDKYGVANSTSFWSPGTESALRTLHNVLQTQPLRWKETWWPLWCSHNPFIFFEGLFYYNSREMGGEKVKHLFERVILIGCPNWDQVRIKPETWAYGLTENWNGRPFSNRTMLQPTEPYQPGQVTMLLEMNLL